MKNVQTSSGVMPTEMTFLKRHALHYQISGVTKPLPFQLEKSELVIWDRMDIIYRTLCGILYNFVPTSGHPGGSISSGHIVAGLVFQWMDYDLSDPCRGDVDLLSYAAGHKAMGLYAMWALRNELTRAGRPDLLGEEKFQLRFEDLLGFRRNPTHTTPLFKKFRAKALDGHPTCIVPFIKVASGPSGVGVPLSFGLAMGALDAYGKDTPRIHVLEGEGGMTPGRVHEALAAAASAGIDNIIMHVDFNQASIDSNHVCLDENGPGEYVQWNPAELIHFHGWNVISVANGMDFAQVLAGQKLALDQDNGRPTAVVYRTVKGWRYGIEGAASHGAGHKYASEGYYQSLKEFETEFGVELPRITGDNSPDNVEQNFFNTLMAVRGVIENNREIPEYFGGKMAAAKQRVDALKRKVRADGPKLSVLYDDPSIIPDPTPSELVYKPGDAVTLRGALGNAINYLTIKTSGAMLATAADLAGSTSISTINKGIAKGFFNAQTNPKSRLMAIGGICEDAMGAFMAGVSSFGRHIGITSSYGAFIAAMEHVAARLHGISQQSWEWLTNDPYNTWIMVNGHAGPKTGEDGPTHADPQPLQLLQECFPGRVLITLTPWDANEVWPLLITGLKARPAILAPFVTRPADKILDRAKMGLPPAAAAIKGIYAVRKANPNAKKHHGTIVLQGNAVAIIFLTDVLPELEKRGFNLNIFYVTSIELFRALPAEEQERIFPEKLAYEAMGITDFTLPTMYYWVRSNDGLRRSLYPFRGGHFLGSGQAEKVLEEAGVHAAGQIQAISEYAEAMAKR